jgi:hypothetical protein
VDRLPGSPTERKPPSSWLWLAAAAVLLAFPVHFWSKPVGRAMLGRATSPVERCSPTLGATWRFLASAAPLVPSGATYTVWASGPEEEMDAFMLSLGLLGHARGLPSSYYGHPLPAVGGQAEYVLALPGANRDGPGLELIARLGGGVVLRRAPAS